MNPLYKVWGNGNIHINIDPCPKPRMTRSDRWKKRKCVQEYWAFKDKIQEVEPLKNIDLSDYKITFYVPMPKSWSKKKTVEMFNTKHLQTPDLDNFEKALYDAVYKNDSHIWRNNNKKLWHTSGSITLEPIGENNGPNN